MAKTVIITGGSSGIGRSSALRYGMNGYNVVFTGRNEERIKETEQLLAEKNIPHVSMKVDAASQKGAQEVIEKAIEAYGSIDTLICNAGITMRALFEDLDLSVFEKVMDINFMGTIYYVKYALPHILDAKGSIIGISSINGHRGTPARSAYTASKYAMEGFLESLRTEVMHRGVHIMSVSPGFTASNIRNTALTENGDVQGGSPRDEGKMMSSDQVAQAVFKAHQKKKRDIVLTVQGKVAVFLNKWMPTLMDKIVYNVFAKEPDSPLK